MTASRDTRPLLQARPGGCFSIVGLEGGQAFRHRLAGMGLRVGSRVEVHHGGAGRPRAIIVSSGPARFVIGHGMAAKILVRPADPES